MPNEEWVVKWGLLEAREKNFKIENRDDNECAFERNKKFDVENIKNGFHQDSFDEFIEIFNGVDEIVEINLNVQNQVLSHRGNGTVNLFFPIKLKLKFPADVLYQNEIFPFFIKQDVDYIFYLLYNGEFFLLYWDSKQLDSFYGSITVRNFLQSIIDKSTNYEAHTVPPIPFHEKLHFKFDYEHEIKEYNIKSVDNNLISIHLPNSDNEHDFFYHLFSSASSDFRTYFEILRYKNEMNKLEREMSEDYIKLTDECSEFQTLKITNVQKKRRLKKQIKETISRSFSNYAKYNSNCSMYKLDKENALDAIMRSEFFGVHFHYFKHLIDIQEYDFDILHSLITYSKDILVTDEGYYNNLIGVLLGGFLAIIATYVAHLI